VRDYEVVKVEQDVPNEFLLVFDDGDSSSPTTTNGLKDSEARRAGAYYKLIERKMLLKKKRTEVRCHRRSPHRPLGGQDFAHITRF
jgi:RNA polymerase II-associated factor 1